MTTTINSNAIKPDARADRLAADASAANAATSATNAANSASAAASSATTASTKATEASTYAAAAATGAKFYDTIALGNAGVADGATFGVKAGGSDGLTRPTVYRRDSAGTQTLLYAVLAGAEFDTIRAVKDNISSLRTTTNVGSAAVSGGNSGAANTLWVKNAKLAPGKLKSFDIFIATLGSGAIDLVIVTRTPGTNAFTEKARVTLTVVAGANSFTDATLGAITIGAWDYLAVTAAVGGAQSSFANTGGTGYWTLAGTTFAAGTTFTNVTGGTVDFKFNATTDALAILRTGLDAALLSELDTYSTRKTATEAVTLSATVGVTNFGTGGNLTPGAMAYFWRYPVPQKARITGINLQSASAATLDLYAVKIDGANVVGRLLVSGLALSTGVNNLTPVNFGQIVLTKGEMLCLSTPVACLRQDTTLTSMSDIVLQAGATVAAQSALSSWTQAATPMLFNVSWTAMDDTAVAEANRVLLASDVITSTLPSGWTFTGAWTASAGMVPPAGAGNFTSVKAVRGNTYDAEQLLLRWHFQPSASTDRIAFGAGGSLCEVDGNAGTIKLYNDSSTAVVFSQAALPASLVAGRTYRMDAARDKRRNRYTLTDMTTGQQVFREEDNNAASVVTTMTSGQLRGSPQVIVIAGQPVITRFDALVDQKQPRVTILGDSIVNGSGVTLASRWSQLLQSALSGSALISGVDGTTSPTGWGHFLETTRFAKPKYLVWAYGTNDQDAGLANYQEAMRKAQNICAAYGVTLVVCTVPPIPGRTFTNLNAYIRSLTGVKLVQFDRAITTNNDGATFNAANYTGDNIHPNATGHALLNARFAIDVPELFD